MDIFRTLVQVTSSEKKIHYESKVVLAGSCFSENIGKKLEDAKFNVINNPFGIVYNPLSVKRGLLRLLQGNPYGETDLFQQEGMWCSFDHHSRFSGADKTITLNSINHHLTKASKTLKEATVSMLPAIIPL